MDQCPVTSSVSMDATDSICSGGSCSSSSSNRSRSRNSSTSSKGSISDNNSTSSGSSMDQVTDSDPLLPSDTNDAEQSSDGATSSTGGQSTLSPFAEPFLPRLSSSSTSALSGPPKTGNSDRMLTSSSSTPDIRHPQQEIKPPTTATAVYLSRSAATPSEDNEAPSSQAPSLSGGRPFSFDWCFTPSQPLGGRPGDDTPVRVSNHLSTDSGSDSRSEVSSNESGAGNRDENRVPLQPSPSTLCGLPVGYERKQSQQRTVSQAASEDCKSDSSRAADRAINEEEYSMFGGLSFMDQLCESFFCHSENKTAAPLISSFFSFPFASLGNLKESRFLSRFKARDKNDRASCDETFKEANKRSYKRAFSCADDANDVSPPCKKPGILRRSLSMPENLWLKTSDSSDVELQPHSIQRSKSNLTLSSAGTDEIVPVEENKETEERSNYLADGNDEIKSQTPADFILDENGNISTLDNGWSGMKVDASSTAVEKAARDDKEAEWEARSSVSSGRSVRYSGDSGFGSVSEDPACIVEMPELKVGCGPWNEAKSPGSGQVRMCSTHNQRLAMYCTDCCLTICTSCFTDRHLGCDRVLTTSLACKDLRWKLLQMQTTVGSHIHSLESRVQQLKPQVRGGKQRREESKAALNDKLEKVLEQVHARHQQALKDLDAQFNAQKTWTKDSILKAEKTLLLLNYVSKFLEVLRQRDSGWELLNTYDQRLSHLLHSAVQLGEISQRIMDPSSSHSAGEDTRLLSECQGVAFSVAMDSLNSDDTQVTSEQQSGSLTSSGSREVGEKCPNDLEMSEQTWANSWVNNLNAIEWSSPKNRNLGLFGNSYFGESRISDGFLDNGVWNCLFSGISDDSTKTSMADNEISAGYLTKTVESYHLDNTKQKGSLPVFVPKHLKLPDSRTGIDGEKLLQEIFSYMQRFPPPVSSNSSSSVLPYLRLPPRPSLYDDMMETCSLPSPTDLIDDVFHFDDLPRPSTLSSDIYHCLENNTGPAYVLEQRFLPHFPQDVEKTFIADMHLTETGRLVFLDAANQCLKCFNYRQPGSVPMHLPVTKPLSLCSAGWDRVMVSGAERTLAVYSVGRSDIQLVVTRCTRQQYRGLVRASDTLVAAACPETHSVDLLDLAGRVLRSIMPVDFVRGPEVVGVTSGGQLLVVYQPVTPPTCIICFDMAGTVLWTHALPLATRHVSCSKVMGGSDGRVYYALQGDSAVYSLFPDTGVEVTLLSSRQGIQFPSSMAVDEDGKLLVSRNELPSGPFTLSAGQPAPLPSTTEINVFRPEAPPALSALTNPEP